MLKAMREAEGIHDSSLSWQLCDTYTEIGCKGKPCSLLFHILFVFTQCGEQNKAVNNFCLQFLVLVQVRTWYYT